MNTLKKIAFIVAIFISFANNSFGQFRYFLKLFETKDKKFVALIEENSKRQRQVIQKIEDEKAYNDFKNKLKSKEETEIYIPGSYKNVNEFLLFSRSNPLEIELKKEVQQTLSKISGKLEERGHVVGTFRRTGLIQQQQLTIKKLNDERSSLKKVATAEVYISIPETPEEFKNIFNEHNNPQFKNAKKIKEAIKNENNSKVHFLNNSQSFLDEIVRSPENSTLILIGHNEGGEFRFPDGSSKKFETIDSITNIAKRTIIYLSCNSDLFTANLATNYYLTYNDGIALTNRINNVISKDKNPTRSAQQMKKMLNNVIQIYGKEKKQRFQYKIATYSIAASGIGYTIYEIKQSGSK